MPLSPGSHLGPYEVLALIGAGGMGEVYRARDPRLGREVAIKVLPHDRVADEYRRQRFIQEAKAASALNHPHIITIYEIESANGVDFLVMEYVRGKSLDALIPRQGMRLGEALRIGIAVADAVACAHKSNIVHRDLKPANVMVGVDGAVKVLDFGLAKLLTDDDKSDPHAPTRTDEAITKRGAVMGTLAYMSPEQASGEPVDARSDIFSFGAMLYEMVTGERAFAGKTPTDTLANVLSAQPKAPTQLVPALPHDLERTILRCLRKDPARRFQTMADLRVDLGEIKEESDSGVTPQSTVARRRGARAVAVGVLAIVVVAVGVWLFKRSPPAIEQPPMRVVTLTNLKGYANAPSFSPDASQIAFMWRPAAELNHPHIYVTIVGSGEVRQLTAGPGFDGCPRWSPDGREIAFGQSTTAAEADRIHLVSALGGSDLKLSDLPVLTCSSWSPDGRFLAVAHAAVGDPNDAGIYVVPETGGEPRRLTHTTRPTYHDNPTFSPDGRHLAYTSCENLCDVWVLDLDPSLAAVGPARRLTPDSRPVSIGIDLMEWSRDGQSILFDSAPAPFIQWLWRVRADGSQPPERVEVAGLGASDATAARSRDRLAFSQWLSDADIYSFEPGQAPQALLASSSPDLDPAVSPDGRRVAFSSIRGGETMEIFVAARDGSGSHQLTHGPGLLQSKPQWSPNGLRLAFESLEQDGRRHIWTIDAEGGVPRRITKGAHDQDSPTWSRDGHWVYFSTDDGSGRDIWRVSVEGALERVTRDAKGLIARESVDGKSLVYRVDVNERNQKPLMRVPIAGGPPTVLVPCVDEFAIAAQGVYYLECTGVMTRTAHVLNPETGQDRVLGHLEAVVGSFSVTPDGRSILFSKLIDRGANLMLIENFR